MTVLVQSRYAAEYILSEGEGLISRDNATIASGSGLVKPGTILGQVTATKKFVPLAPAANDGSEVAAAVLFAPVDATAADVQSVITSRYAEVKGPMLIYPAGADAAAIAAINAALSVRGIVVR